MDPFRFLQIYVLQGLVGAFFVYLAYKILTRKKKRLNVIFSGFYIGAAIGLFINFIYAPMTNELIVLFLYYLTIFFLSLAGAFLLLFNLIILKSEKTITPKKQLTYILLYSLALIGMIFIPNGVTINATTDWKPVWHPIYFIYVVAVSAVLSIGPSLYFSLEIYKQFENDKLKKKWKIFMYGLWGIVIFMYGTYFSNTLDDPTFRTVWSLIALPLAIISPYFMYYGVGRQLEE